MKNEKHSYQPIYKTLPALLILFTFYTALMPEIFAAASAGNPPTRRTKSAAVQDDFDKKFREGRDLIDKQEWAQAGRKFREAVEKSPDHKSADAALYWLAFCHKKQRQFKEADAALDRLLEKFPASSWAGDARVMKTEIAAPLNRLYLSNVGTMIVPNEGSAKLPPAPSVYNARQAQSLYESLTLGESNASSVPLGRDDEIKIAAFQSLLSADPKRAIDALGEILKSASKASETLKIASLRVLRRSHRAGTETMGSQTIGFVTNSIGKESVPLLRETLVGSFQNETNPKIRKEIIYALASLADGGSTDYLKRLYADAGRDRETKKAIINSFAASNGYSYSYSVTGSSANGNAYAYNSGAARTRKTELEFLLEIVRAEKDAELRGLAFASLLRTPNWTADAGAVETLARLYDAEAEETFKVSIIRAFSSVRQARAVQKLLDIARSDKSDKLRLEAIYALRNSKDPEVLKFLENLIR
jgi:tetratricopeptide (TPR) repeat protein